MTARPGTLSPPRLGAERPHSQVLPHGTEAVSGPVDRRSVLDGPPAPAPRTLVEVFDATRRAWPTNVALEDHTRCLTYDEAWERAGALAEELAALGIGVGDRVGIHVQSGTVELYLAVLGVLRSGAAYVPVEAEDPDRRAATVFAEADVAAVVGPHGVRVRHRGRGRQGPPGIDDDCWVIFTSGSTGTPKGVAVRHRSAAAFVDAEAHFLRVLPTDRVLGGLSVAFDASCEEMWLAWRNGAALVACPRSVVRAGGDLGAWLAAQRVSVLSTVPSLAALLDPEALSGVRLVVLGGEACPEQLGWRLADGGREVWNTYGPTESTVVSAAARVTPGEPILIGQPLAGERLAVVDDAGRPVEAGEPGELVIAGVGLGRYLDRRLDAARYAPLPSLGWGRAYRTGDRARLVSGGIAFLGRADDQVKLSGRRIELGEVDRHLAAAPGVRSAAAAVRTTPAGNSMLVGYVTGAPDPDEVRRFVAERLPAGVVPAIVVLDQLPTTTAGKVDREALPWPPPGAEAGSRPAGRGTRAWLAERWAEQLGEVPIDDQSDFFELGGTSMAAAKLVSALRARFPALAVADLYQHRRLGDLADHLERLSQVSATATDSLAHGRRFAAGQLAGVAALFVLDALGWVLAVLAFDQLLGVGLRVGWVPLVLAWALLETAPGNALVVVGCRRLLLRDLSPGRYPRDGWLAWRIWFVERLADRHHLEELEGTPMAARYARLLGVPVGRGACLGTLPSPACLVTIGAGATLEADVDLYGWVVEGSELVVGTIEIGPGARVGTRAALMPGARVGADAEIEPGSVVSATVPAGERWSGVPARPDGRSRQGWPPAREPAPPSRWWSLAYLGAMALIALVPLVSAVPGLVLLDRLGGFQSWPQAVRLALEWSPVLAAVFLAAYALVVGLGCRWVAHLIQPGWHPATSWTSWALWVHGSLLEATHVVLFPLYSTVYTRWWLRLLGVRVGRRSEVCTAVGVSRLVEIGETSFLTDDVVFACSRAGWGWLEVRPSEVASRSFVGNSAILRPSTRLGEGTLVGVLSVPPLRCEAGTSWLGAPSFELPRVVEPADPKRTTDPPGAVVLARGLVEIVRVLLPATLSLCLGAAVLGSLEVLATRAGWAGLVVGAPVVVVLAALAAGALTVAAKWVVIGRYEPGEHPLWSTFVWRDEIVNSLHEQLAGAWLLTAALATPIMNAYLRAMGAAVGPEAWVETLSVTEFDLVDVGRGVAINRGACIETHLFHDRLMRLGPARLAEGVTLGPHAVVLLDAEVGAGASVGARSVVLRAERLPAGTRWLGIPVRVE